MTDLSGSREIEIGQGQAQIAISSSGRLPTYLWRILKKTVETTEWSQPFVEGGFVCLKRRKVGGRGGGLARRALGP